MKKFTALFTDSLEELKHVNTVTVMAMFAAISVVLGYFTLVLGDYLKIGIPCIMPVIKIVQRVFRLLRQLLGSKIGAPIMTGRKKQQTQQQPHDRTAQSSTELFSAEKKLRKIPYISVGESFHCAAFTFI